MQGHVAPCKVTWLDAGSRGSMQGHVTVSSLTFLLLVSRAFFEGSRDLEASQPQPL